jgi:hypothetical protein
VFSRETSAEDSPAQPTDGKPPPKPAL